MRRTKPHLQLVPSLPPGHPQPPGPLDQFGMDLWISITSQYEFEDPGSIEILYQACCCRSRAERCRQQIDRQGEVIVTKAGPRTHPTLMQEHQNRVSCARLIEKLGLALEPVHPTPGRPSGR